jgi:hypothetical protein
MLLKQLSFTLPLNPFTDWSFRMYPAARIPRERVSDAGVGVIVKLAGGGLTMTVDLTESAGR